MSERRARIHTEHALVKTRRCALLNVLRSSAYYRPAPASTRDSLLMQAIDEIHLRWPFYGNRRQRDEFQGQGHAVNRKRVQRLMRQMGFKALYPRRAERAVGERSQDLLLPAAGSIHRVGEPGLGERHLLYPHGQGVHVSGGYHGLVFSPGALLAGVIPWIRTSA